MKMAAYKELGSCVLFCDYANADRVLVRLILVFNTSSAVANSRKIFGGYKNNNNNNNNTNNDNNKNLLIFHSSPSSRSMIYKRIALSAHLGLYFTRLIKLN
jgi:hypothetical protein